MRLVNTPRNFHGPAFRYSIQQFDGSWLTDYAGALSEGDLVGKILHANPNLSMVQIKVTRLPECWEKLANNLGHG